MVVLDSNPIVSEEYVMRQDGTIVPRARSSAAWWARIVELSPGIALCVCVALVSIGIEQIEHKVLDHVYVDALVFGILLGIFVRNLWRPSKTWQAGIGFSAKQMLEAAVMLLGASISVAAIIASGWFLFAAVVFIVAVSLCASFLLSRMLRLSTKLSILIACGNSICGNSAIAAVAPVIGASGDDVASSISFTAILGVVMVLALPLLIPLLQLSATQYGVVAGLTVYAVPQVLAATVPAGFASTQIGTLVKLTRVLMLGPVVVGLSLIAPAWLRESTGPSTGTRYGSILRFVPWFILGFILLAAMRSLGIIPPELAGPIRSITTVLTVVSMVALGLGVDLKILGTVGGRVTLAVTLSLLLLLAMSLVVVHVLGSRVI